MLGRAPLGIAARAAPLDLDERLYLLPHVHAAPLLVDAAGGTRTHKRFHAADFESASFANLDTAARRRRF
jgi:hypothetical protein